MYFVKQASPNALPLFSAGTFLAVVKWLLKGQKNGVLHHDQYEIYGSDLKAKPLEFVAMFEIERELQTADELL
jgi:hypothetical protein